MTKILYNVFNMRIKSLARNRHTVQHLSEGVLHDTVSSQNGRKSVTLHEVAGSMARVDSAITLRSTQNDDVYAGLSITIL